MPSATLRESSLFHVGEGSCRSRLYLHVKHLVFMKLLFLTDPHFEKDSDSYSQAIELIEDEKPDILLLGGDYGNINTFTNFLNEAAKHVNKIFFILGNNDEFEPSQIPESPHNTTYVDGNVEVVGEVAVCGISRNVSFRPRPYRRTIREFLSIAREVAGKVASLPEEVWVRVLMLHDVSREILEAFQTMGKIQAFNPAIADAVSKAIRLVQPNIVLMGHLHAKAHMLILVTGNGHRIVETVSTWHKYRTYITIQVQSNKLLIEIKDINKETLYKTEQTKHIHNK